MSYLSVRLLVVAFGAVLMILSGCASTPPAKFYLLTPLPDAEQGRSAAGKGVVVGIGPVELPEYLDRSQIVTRTAQNELNLAEFDRWAESLKNNFTRVLAEDLAALVPIERVVIFPWDRSENVNYQVAIRVIRFDDTVGEDSVLVARWRILNADEKELLVRKSTHREHPGGQDYSAIVAAMNRALADLSREIAAALRNLNP